MDKPKTAQLEASLGDGVLLPTTSGRLRACLQTVAGLTVFAFTLTSVVPPGWAWPSREDQTLRTGQARENGVETGLEERLREQAEVSLTTTIATEPPTPASQIPPVPANSNLWENRQAAPAPILSGLEEAPPPAGVTRRGFLQASAVVATSAVVLGSAAQAQAQIQGIEPVPAALDGAFPFNPGVGAVSATEPNTFVIHLPTGTVHGPEGGYVETPRGPRDSRPIWDAAQTEMAGQIRQLMAQVGRRAGIQGGPISDDRLQKVWNAPADGGWAPATFSPVVRGKETPVSYQPQRSYTIWSPHLVDKEMWPAIFQGLRKAAGLKQDEVGRGYHTRLYMDPYGMLDSFRTWPAEDVRELLEQARRNGVQIVPILGDPTFALYPDNAAKMIRSLLLTGLFPPDGDGVRRLALDIEPHELDGYYRKDGTLDEAQAEVYWANALRVVEEARSDWSHRMAQAALDDHRDMEVTLFVPPHFFEIARKRGLKVPQGTRLMLMAHSDSPEKMAGMAAAARRAMEQDAALPEGDRLFHGTTLGVQADIGAAKTENLQKETLWRDPAQPYAQPVGERTSKAGRLVGGALQGAASFNGEYCVHTADILLDLLPFLVQGGVNAEWMADREIRNHLAQLREAFTVVSRFLSAIPYETPPSKYGQLPNGRSAEDITDDYLFMLNQRFTSGAVGTGAIIAHWITLYETLVQSWRRGGPRVRFHPDVPLAGPDLGVPYGVGRWLYSTQFGEEGQIRGLAQTVVDPSQPGEPVSGLSPDGELIRGVRRTNPATGAAEIVVTGWAGNLKSEGTDMTVKPGDVVLGTRLPDGQIVPGRAVVPDPDSLVDSSSKRRKENGRRVEQVPSNGYDFYWTVDLHNAGERLFRGYVRIYPHSGDADPIELTSDNVDLESGEGRKVTLSVRAGFNHNGDPVDPGSRSNTDLFARQSQLPRDRVVHPAVFLVNTAGVEISDAVGVAAYDPSYLASQAVQEPRRRRQVLDEAGKMIREAADQGAPLSELNYYAPGRSLGLRLRLDPASDPKAQDPEALVRSVAGLKEQHGATHLVVEAPDLLALVDEYRRLRGSKKKTGVIGFVEGSVEAMEMVNRIWAKHPAAIQVRRLLREARAQGFQVSFLINAADAPLHGDAEVLGGDKTGARDFFRILKNLTETYVVGLDTTYHTVVENWDSLGKYKDGHQDPALRRENQAWVARLYANAQSPLRLLGDSDAPAPLEVDTAAGISIPTPRVHDLTGKTVPEALKALKAVQGEDRPLGLALLTPEQCRACPPLQEKDAQRLVDRLLGDPKEAKDPTARRVVTPLWLSRQLTGLVVHRTAVDRLVLERVLRLRLVVPIATGHFSVPAHQLHPTPTRDMIVRLRMFHEGTGRLYSMEYPLVGDREVDISRPVQFHVTGMPPGIWVVNAEIIGAPQNPVFPNEPNVSNLPLVTIEGEPGLFPINSVDPQVDAWIPVRNSRVRFNPKPPTFVEVNVNGEKKSRYLKDHWAVTVRWGDGKEGVLHVGRDATEEKVLFWPEGKPDQVKELVKWSDPAVRTSSAGEVMVGGVRVGVRIQGGPEGSSRGRIQLEIDGRRVDLWDSVDQKAHTGKRVIVRTEHSGTQLTARLDQPVLGASPLTEKSPVPDLASGLPEEVRDSTEGIIPYPHLSEGAGRWIGRGILAGGALAAGKGVVNALVGWSERSVASARSPFRTPHTPKSIAWLGWNGRLMTLAKVGTVTLLALWALAAFPPTAALLGLGAGWAAQVAAVPLVGPVLGFLAAKLAAAPVAGAMLAQVNAALAGQAAWATAAGLCVKLAAGLLGVRFVVDGLGALAPGVSNWPNRAVRFLNSRVFHLEQLSPEAARPLETGVASVVGAPWVFTGILLRGLADAGKWLCRGILLAVILAFPVNWAAVGIPIAAMPVGSALWMAGSEILKASLLHPAAPWIQAAVWGMGGLMAALWLRHAWEVGRNQREPGQSFNFAAVLSGPVMKLCLAGVAATALAVSVPAWFGGGIGAITVLGALKFYLAYRVLAASARVLAEMGVEGIGALATGVSVYAATGSSFLACVAAAAAGFGILAARTFPIWAQGRERPLPDIGRVPNGSPLAVRVLLSHELWAAGLAVALAWWPLRLLAAAAVPGGTLGAWLIRAWGPITGHSLEAFLTSPNLYTIASVLIGGYWGSQYLLAAWRRLWIPLYRKFLRAPEGLTTPPLPSLAAAPSVTPGLPTPPLPPPAATTTGLEENEGPGPAWTREGVTQQETRWVQGQAVAMADRALSAQGFPGVDDLLAQAARLPAGSPERRRQEEFVESLVNGMALRTQEARKVVGMDVGADLMQGPTNWTLTDMFRRLEGSDSLTALNANISVDPAGNPEFFGPGHRYFYGGLGAVVFPVLWGSQKVQYSVAMFFRTTRAGVTEPVGVVFLYGSGVHSDMENNPEAFISEVMGRWLEGHTDVVASELSGLFVLNPNRSFRSDVRLFRGQADQVEFLGRLSDDPVSQLAAAYVAERDEWDYNLGMEKPGLAPQRLVPQEFTDEDLRIFGTGHLDSGDWAMSPRGRERLLFAPIQFAVRDGKLVPAGMGRWSVVYREEGDHPRQAAFTKSAALHGFLGLLHGQNHLEPRISQPAEPSGAAPQVTWAVEPLHELSDRAHGLRTAEEVEREVRGIKQRAAREGREAYLSTASRFGADGVWRRPGQVPPEGFEDLGPPLGLKVFGSLFGAAVQLAYSVIDVLTGKYWVTTDTLAELLGRWRDPDRTFRGKLADLARSLPYILGGPFGIAGIVMLFTGGVGWGVVAVCLLMSSWSLEWIWRRPHEVSYFGFRKHPLQADIQGYYDPEEVLDLTVRVTRALPPLPAAYRSDAGYEALGTHGQQLLEGTQVRGGGSLLRLVTQYARVLSPEQRAENRNKRSDVWVPGWQFSWNPLRIFEGWRQTLGRQIRQEITRAGWRPGSDDYLAAQRAILQVIKGEHLAAGNPEAQYLYAGSDSPQIQHRQDLNLTPVGRRTEDPDILAVQDVMEAMAGEAVPFRRGWSFNRRYPEPMRVTSRQYLAPPPGETAGLEEGQVDTWGNGAGATRNREHFGQSYLRPATNSQVQTAAQASLDLMPFWVKLLGSPDLRYGGMLNLGPTPRQLGGISALVTAGAWWGLGATGLLGAVGLAAPSLGTAAAVGAGAVAAGLALQEASHALDNLGTVGRVLNRAAGSALSLWVGYKLAVGAHAAITAAAGAGTLAAIVPGLAIAAAVLIGAVALSAAAAAWFNDRQDARTNHGWPGEGLSAVGRIPGRLLQVPAMLLFKAVVLSADKWAPAGVGIGAAAWAFLAFGWVPALIALPVGVGVGALLSRRILKMPWSWDVYLCSVWLGIDPDTLGGLVDRMEHPVVAGTALVPGKLMGRPTVGWRRYTEMEATPVPVLRAVQLSREPNWTRELSGLNLLWTAVRAAGLGLAEDSLASWVWEVMGYEGEPVVAAFGMANLDKQLRIYEESRDDAGSFQRATQFAKGAGRYLSNLRLQEEMTRLVGELGAMGSRERALFFASMLWALEQREQGDTGSSGGAGAYSFLFTSFTVSQLAMKVVGHAVPGEEPAFLQFLYYLVRDREMGGALARQIFQLNAEQPGNPLAHADFPANGTLADRAVLELLLGQGSTVPLLPVGATGGWAVDPRAALAAAKVARQRGWWAMKGVGERVSMRDLFVRIVGGFFNKPKVMPIKSVAKYRRVVTNLEKHGKGQFIRLKMDWGGQRPAGIIWSRELGASKSAQTVLDWRAEYQQGAAERARNPEQFRARPDETVAGLEEATGPQAPFGADAESRVHPEYTVVVDRSSRRAVVVSLGQVEESEEEGEQGRLARQRFAADRQAARALAGDLSGEGFALERLSPAGTVAPYRSALMRLYADEKGLERFLESVPYFKQMAGKSRKEFRATAQRIRNLLPDAALGGDLAADLEKLNLAPKEVASKLAQALVGGAFADDIASLDFSAERLVKDGHARLFADEQAIRRVLRSCPPLSRLEEEQMKEAIQRLRSALRDVSLRPASAEGMREKLEARIFEIIQRTYLKKPVAVEQLQAAADWERAVDRSQRLAADLFGRFQRASRARGVTSEELREQVLAYLDQLEKGSNLEGLSQKGFLRLKETLMERWGGAVTLETMTQWVLQSFYPGISILPPRVGEEIPEVGSGWKNAEARRVKEQRKRLQPVGVSDATLRRIKELCGQGYSTTVVFLGEGNQDYAQSLFRANLSEEELKRVETAVSLPAEVDAPSAALRMLEGVQNPGVKAALQDPAIRAVVGDVLEMRFGEEPKQEGEAAGSEPMVLSQIRGSSWVPVLKGLGLAASVAGGMALLPGVAGAPEGDSGDGAMAFAPQAGPDAGPVTLGAVDDAAAPADALDALDGPASPAEVRAVVPPVVAAQPEPPPEPEQWPGTSYRLTEAGTEKYMKSLGPKVPEGQLPDFTLTQGGKVDIGGKVSQAGGQIVQAHMTVVSRGGPMLVAAGENRWLVEPDSEALIHLDGQKGVTTVDKGPGVEPLQYTLKGPEGLQKYLGQLGDRDGQIEGGARVEGEGPWAVGGVQRDGVEVRLTIVSLGDGPLTVTEGDTIHTLGPNHALRLVVNAGGQGGTTIADGQTYTESVAQAVPPADALDVAPRPVPAPVAAPAAAPAASQVQIDQSLLDAQARVHEPGETVRGPQAERARKLFDAGAVSQSELEVAEFGLAQDSVHDAQKKMTDVLRRFRQMDPGDDWRPLWQDYRRALDGFLGAQERELEARVDVLQREHDRRAELNKTLVVPAQKVDEAWGSLAQARLTLQKTHLVRLLYRDLGSLGPGSHLPIPQMTLPGTRDLRDLGAAFPNLEDTLAVERRQEILASAAEKARGILELDSEQLEVQITLSEKDYARAEKLFTGGFSDESTFDGERFARTQNTLKRAQQGRLAAQGEVLRAYFGPAPDEETRQKGIVAAQKELDRTIREELEAAVYVADQLAQYRDREMQRAGKLLDGAVSTEEYEGIQYTAQEAAAEAHLLRILRDWHTHTRALGKPAASPLGTAPLPGSVALQTGVVLNSSAAEFALHPRSPYGSVPQPDYTLREIAISRDEYLSKHPQEGRGTRPLISLLTGLPEEEGGTPRYTDLVKLQPPLRPWTQPVAGLGVGVLQPGRAVSPIGGVGGTEPTSGQLDAQQLVPPVTLGLDAQPTEAETRGHLDALEGLRRDWLTLQIQSLGRRISWNQSRADRVEALYNMKTAHKTPSGAQEVSQIPRETYDDSRDLLRQNRALGARRDRMEAERELLETDEVRVRQAWAKRNQAVLDELRLEAARVDDRLAVLMRRVENREKSEGVDFSTEETREMLRADVVLAANYRDQLNLQLRRHEWRLQQGRDNPLVSSTDSLHSSPPVMDRLERLAQKETQEETMSGFVRLSDGTKAPFVSGPLELWLIEPVLREEGRWTAGDVPYVQIPVLDAQGKMRPEANTWVPADDTAVLFATIGPASGPTPQWTETPAPIHVAQLPGPLLNRQLPSGWYPAESSEGMYKAKDNRPTPLGKIRASKLDEEGLPVKDAAGQPVTEDVGAILYPVTGVRQLQRADGTVSRESVPVGFRLRIVPLEKYLAFTAGEAPLPPESGSGFHGTVYLGGFETVDPEGEAIWGRHNEEGEIIQVVDTTHGVRIFEPKIIFRKGTGDEPGEWSEELFELTPEELENRQAERPAAETPATAGLEEAASAVAAATPAAVLAMSPAQVRGLASRLQRERAELVVLDVNASLDRQVALMGMQEQLFKETVMKLSSSAPVRGWTPPESSKPVVFLFDDPSNIGWAPLVARSGAPVAVIAQTAQEADGMIELLKATGVPDGSFAVEPLDLHGGDREAALRALDRSFSDRGIYAITGVIFQEVPRTSNFDDLERFFQPYNITLSDTAPLKIGIDRYLGSLA